MQFSDVAYQSEELMIKKFSKLQTTLFDNKYRCVVGQGNVSNGTCYPRDQST